MSENRIVWRNGSGEVVEKKSRFIADIIPVHSEEEAAVALEGIHKKYRDASHHCYAFVLGKKHELQRCSDDGEPSGTAGKPILNILLGENIYDVLAVVTRYFGGTLLGTGGLVRAYGKAVREGLLKSIIMEECLGKAYEMHVDYPEIGKIQYLAGITGVRLSEIQYLEKITLKALAPLVTANEFEKKVREATNGKAVLSAPAAVCYGVLEDGEWVLLSKQASLI